MASYSGHVFMSDIRCRSLVFNLSNRYFLYTEAKKISEQTFMSYPWVSPYSILGIRVGVGRFEAGWSSQAVRHNTTE